MESVERIKDYVGTGSERREGGMTKLIESQTAAIPSGTYLSLAIFAMGASLVFMMAGRRNIANFVGQWAPTILIMGLYNKLVKQHGHDAED